MRQREPLRDAGGGRDGMVGAGRDDPVDVLGAREPVDRRLVLDRDDRAAVGVAEARRGGVAVGRHDGQAAPPRRREDAELRRPGAEDEEPRRLVECHRLHSRPCGRRRRRGTAPCLIWGTRAGQNACTLG